MALQYPCEKCSEHYPEDQLVLIDLVGKLLCPVCINDLISTLKDEIEYLQQFDK